MTGEGAGSIFIIDEYNGKIYVIQKVDREEKPFYILRAQALNRNTHLPVEPESEFIIKVRDINDHEPQFLDGPYVATVPEMSPEGMTCHKPKSYMYQSPFTDSGFMLVLNIETCLFRHWHSYEIGTCLKTQHHTSE